MSFLSRLIIGLVSGLALVIAGVGVTGYFLYSKSRVDALKPVSAIVVLGGEHDGREAYAIALARQGVSNNVVLSNPHWSGDKEMAAYCALEDPSITVHCVRPNPATTRGEAQFTRELAAEHGWTSVLVISWRYHLPRARYIFSQCFSGEVLARPVPRDYDFGPAEWEYNYLYQTMGFAKAFIQGDC